LPAGIGRSWCDSGNLVAGGFCEWRSQGKNHSNNSRGGTGKKRGYYAGVFGYFDGARLESAVMIRFIEKAGDKLFYRSGGRDYHSKHSAQRIPGAIDKNNMFRLIETIRFQDGRFNNLGYHEQRMYRAMKEIFGLTGM